MAARPNPQGKGGSAWHEKVDQLGRESGRVDFSANVLATSCISFNLHPAAWQSPGESRGFQSYPWKNWPWLQSGTLSFLARSATTQGASVGCGFGLRWWLPRFGFQSGPRILRCHQLFIHFSCLTLRWSPLNQLVKKHPVPSLPEAAPKGISRISRHCSTAGWPTAYMVLTINAHI